MPIFNASLHHTKHVDGLQSLFSDVDLQLKGIYRLAGGSRVRLDVETEDLENRHAFHRLRWAVRYAEASFFGHTKAKDGLINELRAWMEEEWLEQDILYWPYTVSERIASLTEVLFWSSAYLQDETFAVLIKRQLWRDAEFLSRHVEHHLGAHNHVANNARALYRAGRALADCEEASDWRNQAVQIWEEIFPALLFDDGFLAEQSTHYHFLLSRTALEFLLAQDIEERYCSAELRARLLEMLGIANDLIRPDGSLARFGDNSPDRTIEDLWGLLNAAKAAGFLEGPLGHACVTPLSVFYGVVPRTQAPATSAEPRSAEQSVSVERGASARHRSRVWALPDGGVGKLQGSGLDVTVYCRPDPAVRAHGDTGRGSYEIWFDGVVLIRDAGIRTFDGPDAAWYRGPGAQNVTTINGLAPALRARRPESPSWYVPAAGRVQMDDAAIAFDDPSFQRIRPGIRLSRRWKIVESGRLEFVEKIRGSAEDVSLSSYVHLGDAAWQRIGAGQFRYACGRNVVEMALTLPPNTSLSVERAPFAPEYGLEREGRRLVISGRAELPLEWAIIWTFAN